jgi:hypothetical protein
VSGLHCDYNRFVPRRHAYPDANSHRHSVSYADPHGHGYFDSQIYAYTTFNADTEAASHSGAEILMPVIGEK